MSSKIKTAYLKLSNNVLRICQNSTVYTIFQAVSQSSVHIKHDWNQLSWLNEIDGYNVNATGATLLQT